MKKLAKTVVWIVALFYTYGALVHVLNIAGLMGFDWLAAPRKWQLLDIVYLLLDVTVVIGFVRLQAFGFVAFLVAAVSQIVLYTFFRQWIIDVPDDFAVSAQQIAHLDTLVIFHAVTLVAVSWTAPALLRSHGRHS